MVYTDLAWNDAGAVQSFGLDMAFGADEQDFELTCTDLGLTGGELVYMDGTEYGGVVDQVRRSTASDAVTYIGRTWHGILAGKVVKPPEGQDHYTLAGDANAAISSLIVYVGLTGVLTARSSSAGFSVSYQAARFANAYDVLLNAMRDAGAVLRIMRKGGVTEVWAEQTGTVENEADSDLMQFEVTKAHRVVNHLVCAGEGELQDRVVVDLYADASGNVSTTQTFSGVDEIALYYNYSGADAAELAADGAKKLKEYQTNGGASIDSVGRGEWFVGQNIQARDNRTGTVVTALIAKKVVQVELGVLTVEYEVGDDVAAQAASFDTGLSGIAEQPVPVAISRATANALINELNVGSSATIYDDDTYVITQNTDTTLTNYLRRPIVKLWDYIKTKADAVYATAAALAGKADADSVFLLKGATSIAANSDLNDFADTGTYYATSGNAATIANTPYAGAFKLYVERTLSTATYLKQRFEIYNGVNEWVRFSTDGGSTWGDWYREAPHSTSLASANRFLATPNGSAGLPSYRAIVNADLPTVDAAHGGTGETTLGASIKALINALGTASTTPTDDMRIIAETSSGGTDTYYRRKIGTIWPWILGKFAPATYDVKTLITQTSTQSGNFTIDSATLWVSGYAAQLEVTFKISAALTAGTEYGIGTLNSSIRPVMRSVAGIGDRRAFADISGGVMYMRPEVAMSASTSTSYYFDCSYILANSYTG